MSIDTMTHVMNQTMNAVLGDPGVVEDRNLLPPDVPDAEPITEADIAKTVDLLKKDIDEWRHVGTLLSESYEFADILRAIEEDNPDMFFHMCKLAVDELWRSRGKEWLENN